MAALYANENYPLGIVKHLRILGHDVLTSLEAGKAGYGLPDEEVLQFATSKGRAVITHNRRHFFRPHRETEGRHAGIIACTYDPNEVRQAKRVDAALREIGESMTGVLLRVYRP